MLVRSPYFPGARLTLLFIPERDDHATVAAIPPEIEVTVEVVRTFEPFTVAQVMIVRRISSHPTLCLPQQFVLKLIDPRFCEPDEFAGLNRARWTLELDRLFRQGLENVRSGHWPNFWKRLGATQDISVFDRGDPYWEASPQIRNLAEEVDRWETLRRTYSNELVVYRQLHRLQGHGIPTLYGVCRCVPADASGLDSYTSYVPGLVIEYIDGVALGKLTVGKDISEEDAERVSQGVLRVVRGIRDHLVLHDDLAARNIIVRPRDLDHPVVIDFGSAYLRHTQSYPISEETWIDAIVREGEIFRVRQLLGKLGFHRPSPVPEEMRDLVLSSRGHRAANNMIQALPAKWREQLYEPLENVPASITCRTAEGKETTWDYPRWRIKAGVQTANASADYKWGKAEYGWTVDSLPRGAR